MNIETQTSSLEKRTNNIIDKVVKIDVVGNLLREASSLYLHCLDGATINEIAHGNEISPHAREIILRRLSNTISVLESAFNGRRYEYDGNGNIETIIGNPDEPYLIANGNVRIPINSELHNPLIQVGSLGD